MEWACELLGIDKAQFETWMCRWESVRACVRALVRACVCLCELTRVHVCMYLHAFYASPRLYIPTPPPPLSCICSWKIGTMVVPRPHSEVETCRETIAKLLYSKLFEWLVARINRWVWQGG